MPARAAGAATAAAERWAEEANAVIDAHIGESKQQVKRECAGRLARRAIAAAGKRRYRRLQGGEKDEAGE